MQDAYNIIDVALIDRQAGVAAIDNDIQQCLKVEFQVERSPNRMTSKPRSSSWAAASAAGSSRSTAT